MHWDLSTHRLPKPSVPNLIEDLGCAATVLDLLDEEVLEMPDGEVKSLIVRVVCPREVLPLTPMQLKKLAP